MTESDGSEYRFDLAVTFAGEDRDFVQELVDGLGGDLTVFYDENYQIETWGEDLVEYFSKVYQKDARYVVMFISRHYAEKMWTTHERRSALARAVTQRSAYILPVRLDDTELDGLLPTVGYLDARRIGLSGLIEAIKLKVGGSAAVVPRSPSDRRVPRTQDAIAALVTERGGFWEYLLYAGLLLASVDSLEPKYRDHAIEYAARSGNYVATDSLHDYVQSQMAGIQAIVRNFERVFAIDAQTAAFGRPGEPGDADRILHLADRFTSVYEDFMDWAAGIRGTSTSGVHAAAALQALARWADQPLGTLRTFVTDLVALLDTIEERIASGETGIVIEMTVHLALDDDLAAEFQRELSAAFDED